MTRIDKNPDPYAKQASRIREPRRFETIATMKSTMPQGRTSFDIARNIVQTIPNVTPTAVNFNADTFDTDGLHDLAVPNRVTLPSASRSSVWLFLSIISWVPNAVGQRIIQVRKNGVTVVNSMSVPAPAGGTSFSQEVVALDIDARPNDYYEVILFQSSGGPLDINGGNFGGTDLW